MGNKMKNILSPAYSLKLKSVILLLTRVFLLFKWSYSQQCFDVAKRFEIHVENNNVVSTLSNVAQINFVIENVDLALFNVANFNVDVHNVVQH